MNIQNIIWFQLCKASPKSKPGTIALATNMFLFPLNNTHITPYRRMLYLHATSHKRRGTTASGMDGNSSWKGQPRDKERQQCSTVCWGWAPCTLQEHPLPWGTHWDLALAAGFVWDHISCLAGSICFYLQPKLKVLVFLHPF